MTSMAKYLLTGIDDKQWRLFKASCDIHGITIKEALLEDIDLQVSVFKKRPEYTKIEPFREKIGGKKK
ncbi:hypothetical protein ES703_10730 [subsurface metagenome]